MLNAFEKQFGFSVEKASESGARVVKYTPEIKTKTVTENRSEVMLSAVSDAEDADTSGDIEWKNTTAKMLFNHLYEACNILRGPIEQQNYKSYIIPILFYKRLSDVYDEETMRALEESGGDEEYAAFPENHRFFIPEGCHWNELREQTENVGSEIIRAMTNIERANPDTLYGVFSSLMTPLGRIRANFQTRD